MLIYTVCRIILYISRLQRELMYTPSLLASCTLSVFRFPCPRFSQLLPWFLCFCTLFFSLHGCQVAAEGQQDQLVLQRPVKSSSHHSSRHRTRDRERDRDRDRDRDRNRERGRDRERERDNTWPIEKHTNVPPQARNCLLFFFLNHRFKQNCDEVLDCIFLWI